MNLLLLWKSITGCVKINWTVVGVLFAGGLFVWGISGSVKQRTEEEKQKRDWIYSEDRTWCEVYTVLGDFDYHPGLRRSVTLTMTNGEKFLYRCDGRAIDICNSLEVGVSVCYDKYHSEVVVAEDK